LRSDSATEYQQGCSKLAESGSIILTAHTLCRTWFFGRSSLVVGTAIDGFNRPPVRAGEGVKPGFLHEAES
jgi:hypothetical protein